MFLKQVFVKTIMPGRNRRMRRENDFARDTAGRFFEIDAFFVHPASNGFENGEGAMPFVQVQYARRNTERFQSAESSDAKQQFLPDADAAVAAVEPRHEIAIFGGVPRDIGIEKQQITTPDFQSPDPGAYRTAPGFDLHGYRLAVRSDSDFHRQRVHIGFEVVLLLPAIPVKPLAEIALTIIQSNTDQRDVEIRSALYVVTREDTEASRINRDRLMEAELRRKVCNRTRPQNSGMFCSPGANRLEIFPLPPVRIIDPAMEYKLLRTPFNVIELNLRQQGNRIVIELPETHGIEIPKQTG